MFNHPDDTAPRYDDPFLEGGGEMGELIRTFNWSKTPIGEPADWPSALRNSVSMLLTTSFPILICWGREYIQYYNDAFRPINGESKHPQALGGKASDTYAEIWETIGPMFESVMAGNSVGFPDFMVQLNRNGYLEDCYFDFSYSPIRDDEGIIQGIRVICLETTEKVLTQRAMEHASQEMASINVELAATNKELAETQRMLEQTVLGLAESEGRFRNLIREAPVGIILLSGPEMKVEIVNDAYGKLIGRTAAELYGRNLFDIIPEAELNFRSIIDGVRESGKALYLYDHPYMVYNGDQEIQGFLNLIYQPYKEADSSITGVIVLCNDVTEQVNTHRRFEENEKRFRFILNAIPQHVWTATPDGALNYVNQVVCDDFGYSSEDIVGHGWKAFIHKEDQPGCFQLWETALDTGKEYLTEFRLLMHNGLYRWHLVRALPYLEDGKVILWLGTNTDIELQKQNEQKKDEFLSIASHELRTPLTSIKAFNQIMHRLNDPERLAGFISKSAEHIYRLEKLINDLLDVTRINAGKMSYNFALFDFSKMVLDSIESTRHFAPDYDIQLISNIEVSYSGDRIRLEQVMLNFLNNAVKYSPESKTILVSSKMETGSIVVSVQDFGIGLAPDNLENIFDRYYRVDNTAMRFEGLGLGLFISSEILKQHQGSFWIESTEGKGSTFYFQIPLTREEK